MGALFSTVTDTASGALSGSSLASGLTGSLKNSVMSGVKGKAKDKMLGLLQKVIERYMNEACTNPTAFIQKVLDDMKSSTLFPSAVRISLEEQRADVEAAISEVIKTPEMQTACQSKDAKAIAQLIMDIMQGKIDLEDAASPPATATNVPPAASPANTPVTNIPLAASPPATNAPVNVTNNSTNNTASVTGGRRNSRRSHRRSSRRSHRRSHKRQTKHRRSHK